MKDKRSKKPEVRVIDSANITKPKQKVRVSRVKVRLDLSSLTLSQVNDLGDAVSAGSEAFKSISQLLQGVENMLKGFRKNTEAINGIFLNIKMASDRLDIFASSFARGVVIFDPKLLDLNAKVLQGAKLGKILNASREPITYNFQANSRYIDYDLVIEERSNIDTLRMELSLVREDLRVIKESIQIGSIVESWTFDNDTALLKIGGKEIGFLGAKNQRKLLEAINSDRNKRVWAIDELVEVMEHDEDAYGRNPNYWIRFLRNTTRNIKTELAKKGFNKDFIQYKNKTLIIHQIDS